MSKFLIYGLANGEGGIEAIVLSIVRELKDNNVFDILLSEGACNYSSIFAQPNINRINITSWGTNRIKFRKELKNILQGGNYDYVWVNGCLMSNKTIIKTTKKYSNAKIITHSHGSSFEEKNFLKRVVLLFLHYLHRGFYHNNVDVPCMCSHRSGDWFYGKRFCENKNVYMIKNGIVTDEFLFNEKTRQLLRDEFNILENQLVLFHAGRLTPVKNQFFLLQIMSEIVKSNVNVKLFIAGEGELENGLKIKTEELNLQNHVAFLGMRNDMNKLYQIADAFILPSFHEGFPVTMIEAQAAGLPCFVSEGITEEVNISGKVFFRSIHTNTPKEWADLILSNASTSQTRKDGLICVKEKRYDIEMVCEDFLNHLKYANS